jgi:uncharacterized protein (TIGR02996 family)
MTEEETFLSAIREHPEDDTVRLVYADWLAEHGQADRGEFIRVEIELARTPPTEEADERRRAVLYQRRTELLKRHKTEWLAPFTPFAKESSFERGFVQALDVSANAFLHNAEKWSALTPLTRLKITSCFEWDQAAGTRTWWTASLFASPHLARLEVLDLEALGMTAADLGPFAAQPDLSRLRELVLTWNTLRSEGATLLANMPQLSNLEALDLRSNGITDTGARAVALSPYLGRLHALRISRNSIHKTTWALLEDRFGDALMG